jgi:hypothetical protein
MESAGSLPHSKEPAELTYIGQIRNVYKVLIGISEGIRPLVTPINIK